MADILDTFIESAKKSLDEGYYDDVPEAKVQKVSFAGAVRKNAFTLITEIKHASPAGEYSFDNLNVEKAAMDFRACGSDAISVVVEPKIFKGNIANIPIAKKAGLPVLFKDFILGERQMEAAQRSGADAMLLVVKVARREGLDLQSMVEMAHSKGLEVLLEAYDETEMKTAMETDADILGINNRDLQTLKVDISRTANILKNMKLDRPLISESGIKTRADAQFVKNAGAKGILVGTAIWKAPRIEEKIRELRI